MSIEQAPFKVESSEQLNLKQEDRLSTVGSEADSIEHEQQQVPTAQSSAESNTFINEKVEDWPQFSIDKPIKTEQEPEDVISLYFNRGADYEIKQKIRPFIKKVMGEVHEDRKKLSEEENKNFNIRKEVNKRMMGWRTWQSI